MATLPRRVFEIAAGMAMSKRRQRVAGLDDDHLAVNLWIVFIAVEDLIEPLLDKTAYVGIGDAACPVGAADEDHGAPP